MFQKPNKYFPLKGFCPSDFPREITEYGMSKLFVEQRFSCVPLITDCSKVTIK